MTTNTYPGKHPQLKTTHFTAEEISILDVLSKEFYITNGGGKLKLGVNSEYKYAIISPTNVYSEMFNLDREIIVVFSPYETLQARTFDAFDTIIKRHSSLRIEKICNILISADDNIEQSLNELIKNEPETQIIIPFSYKELKTHPDSFFFRNRFRSYFYTRDLFAFEAPLKKDIYFFGRNDLIHELINRFKSGENSGVFGLRKTGKTSLINGIQRNLLKEGIQTIIIDCQDTAFNQRRWYECLHYLCKKTIETYNYNIQLPDESFFTPKEASTLTEEILKRCKHESQHTTFVIFDEIENISRKTSPAVHWKNEIDFVLFWQSLRSIFQRNSGLLSYLIVGTNSSCIEEAKIEDVDNPIFNHFSPKYIAGFEVKDTREMIRKLGRRMGINFEDTIYSRLTDDFGGHPFLMRQVCSLISNEVSNSSRPVTIGKSTYTKGCDEFILNNTNYFEMIIGVLKDSYPEEYEMLTMLALDDIETFNEFAMLNPSYTAHLIGYGLIKKEFSGYEFSIESIKMYLQSKSKYKKLDLSQEDMWSEISSRRNSAEIKLRKIIKMIMQASMGASVAKKVILDIFGSPRREKLGSMSYNDLFNANISEIYFSDLSKIISKNWDIFKNTFTKTKQETFSSLDYINKSRADAHAKELTAEQFHYFRLCMSSIEADLENALN